MDVKIFFGLLAIAISLFGYFFYFRSLYRKESKPHAFSWLIWAVLTITGFSVQFTEHAGPGAWANGVSGMLCAVVFFISLKKGEKNITTMDWLSLGAAIFSLLLWYITSNPILTILLITAIDFFGFIPTARKSFHKPRQENATLYFMSGVSYLLTTFAIENYVFANWFYPLALVVMNWSFVTLVLVRRKQLQK